MMKRSYTNLDIEKAVASSKSIRQVLETLGLNKNGGGTNKFISETIKKLNLDTSHFTGKLWSKGELLGFKRPIGEYLSNKINIKSHTLKLRLIKEGYFEPRCYVCNNTTWQEKPIPIELHHIDGNHNNNDLNNLIIICPNCYSQTPNYKGANKGAYPNKSIKP